MEMLVKTSAGLTSLERRTLQSLARGAVESVVRGTPLPGPPARLPALERPGAAFVSLHRGGRLRGCIGNVEAIRTLWFTVRDVAQCAATRDPRFQPILPEELEGMAIETSVLSTLRRVFGPDDVKIGRDGLVVRATRNGGYGLLLPQVAVERGLDAIEFLAATCVKAGLRRDAWKDGQAEMSAFGAEVISEADRDSEEDA